MLRTAFAIFSRSLCFALFASVQAISPESTTFDSVGIKEFSALMQRQQQQTSRAAQNETASEQDNAGRQCSVHGEASTRPSASGETDKVAWEFGLFAVMVPIGLAWRNKQVMDRRRAKQATASWQKSADHRRPRPTKGCPPCKAAAAPVGAMQCGGSSSCRSMDGRPIDVRASRVAQSQSWRHDCKNTCLRISAAQTAENDAIIAARKAEKEERARLTNVLQGCAKRGDAQGAAHALHKMEAIGTPPLEEYNQMIGLCAKSGDPTGAHKWFNRVYEVGLVPNAVSFNAVINAHAKQAQMVPAEATVAKMVKAGIEPDTVTYNTLIDGYVRAERPDSADWWMEQMLAKGVKPSVVSFASVMRANALAGLSKQVDRWLAEADKLGIELNMICYSAVINAFAKRGDLPTARSWLARMSLRNVPLSIHCFSGLVDAMVKAADIEGVCALVKQMERAGVKPDKTIYNTLVVVSVKAEWNDQALQWARAALAAGVQLNRKAVMALESADLAIPMPQAAPAEPEHNDAVFNSASVDQSCLADDAQSCVGKTFVGIVKEYVVEKFGYISCNETKAIFKRDVFISSTDNPLGFMKGQRVTFKLVLDRKRGLPRAMNIEAYQPQQCSVRESKGAPDKPFACEI